MRYGYFSTRSNRYRQFCDGELGYPFSWLEHSPDKLDKVYYDKYKHGKFFWGKIMQQLQEGDAIYVFDFQDISTEKSEIISYLKEINDKKACLYWSPLFHQLSGLSLDLSFVRVDIPHFIKNYMSNRSIEIIKLVYHKDKKLMDYIKSREKKYYDMQFSWCAQTGLNGYDAEVTCPRSEYLGW